MNYANGTYIHSTYPWGIIRSARALCSDGRIRRTKRIAQTGDTFFSIPASMTVKGKTVAGYITVETLAGYSTETPDDPAIVKFFAYTPRVNAHLLSRKDKP